MAARGADKRDGAKALAGDLLTRVQRAWGESPFYQSQLKGPAPDRLIYKFDDPYIANKKEGDRIASGLFAVGAERVDCSGEPAMVWQRAAKGGRLYRYLHQFSWMRGLSALGNDGRIPAKALTSKWFEDNEKWSPDSWEASLTAERLVMLCAHSELILKDSDILWRSRVLTSMARQARHLIQCAHKARGNYERLQCAAALTLAGLCLPGCDTAVERGLELLRRELRLQLRNDGGHISRNPSHQLAILIRLQIICEAMAARGVSEPGFLRHMMGRIRAHAALFRLGDGGLAIFNGSHEDDRRAVSRALHDSDEGGDGSDFARYSGYKRLEAEKTVLVADIGSATATATLAASGGTPNGRAPKRDAGPANTQWQSDGSFAFAVGKARLVTNCGAGTQLPLDWSLALRQAGAHSALSSDPPDVLAPFLANTVTTHRHGRDGDGSLVEINRQMPRLNARHCRLLFLASDGGDLRGEDRFENFSDAALAVFRLRFHLHPSVRASLSRDRRTVIMALANGEGWHFKTNYRLMSLEKSIYCGESGLPQPCDQIILSGNGLEGTGPRDMVLKWSFKRLSSG